MLLICTYITAGQFLRHRKRVVRHTGHPDSQTRKYRISSNSSRASNTGRGSEPLVLIDAGLRINAGPRIQAGSQIEARYSCTQYCTAGVLLVFVYCTAGVRAIGVKGEKP